MFYDRENDPIDRCRIVKVQVFKSNSYLSVQNLKNLVAIVDGKPVDAGVFNDGNRMVKMKSMKGATAFAVTAEPA